jgi:hypothetical protein
MNFADVAYAKTLNMVRTMVYAYCSDVGTTTLS